MQTKIDLNDFKYIAAIADAKNLNAAAKALGVNFATVFRRLEVIEIRFGVTLFYRQQGVYTPTLAGEELAKIGTTMLNAANDGLRKLAGEDLRPNGLVRITTTESIMRHLLWAGITRCNQEFSDIRLELNTIETLLNLSARDADIAIRASNKPPEHLIGKRICTINMAVFASVEYIAQHKLTPTTSNAILAQQAWLCLYDSVNHYAVTKWVLALKPVKEIVFTANTMTGLQLACEQGLGCAVLPCFLGDQSSRLQRVSPCIEECESALWILMHPDLRSTMRVKVVFDILQQELKQITARLSV